MNIEIGRQGGRIDWMKKGKEGKEGRLIGKPK